MSDVRPTEVMDQAADLRHLVSSISKKSPVSCSRALRTIAVVGGKGGVGKSNLSANVAIALAQAGQKVALFDGDMGLANVDILFGVHPPCNLIHLIRGERSIQEIMFDLGEGLSLIPGGSGVEELANMEEPERDRLINQLSDLESLVDVVVVDTGAGIHKNVLAFASAADTVVLVTTPEPTSIRDGYSLLKALVLASMGKLDVQLVVNMTSSDKEAQSVASRICFVADQFLRLNVGYAGFVVSDPRIPEAVCARSPLLRCSPHSPAAQCFRKVASQLVEGGVYKKSPSHRGLKGFFSRLSRLWGADMERGRP
ncbi:MAG: hydrogenase [Dethiosulfovibrio peptidovorans]|nr:MAG: hydrogenase [Dethiosulfovibrio peptidovorans]